MRERDKAKGKRVLEEWFVCSLPFLRQMGIFTRGRFLCIRYCQYDCYAAIAATVHCRYDNTMYLLHPKRVCVAI